MPLTWFITGCTSGYGELFVRQLRAAGDNVIATGRSLDKLAHLRDTGASLLELDVTSPPAVIDAAIKEAWSIYDGGIDVAVNNAGYIVSGAVEETTQDDIEACMKVNFHGALAVTRAALPHLRARGSGTLLYISSQGGFEGDPSGVCYCASKFALEGRGTFAKLYYTQLLTRPLGAVECLAKELAIISPALKVLIAEPGPCRTPIWNKMYHVEASVPEYAEFNQYARQVEATLGMSSPGDADKAVTRMVELVKKAGLATGKSVPLRVPLGSAAWVRIRNKCEETLKICADWEDFAKSIDCPTE